ncbi:uncharacterized protein PG998_013329 [Apiospora kogelbergensis]|uniref:uncharacterized protein n=1 Tax=Apiospora kogelbergensis TaxID=1337665 RepID=UPI003131624D
MLDLHGHWPETARKRGREEEDNGAAESMGFGDHRNKRLHSLPLRSSPPQKKWSHHRSLATTTLTPTPTDSDSEEMQGRSHLTPWVSTLSMQQQQHAPSSSMEVDRDTDMMDGAADLSGQSAADGYGSSNTGRIPTPIHATFAAQVRGNNWASANQQMHDANSNFGIAEYSNHMGHAGAVAGQHHAFPPAADPSVPRSLDGSAGWSMIQNRRLPSPISESGGEETPTSPGMVLDATQQQQQRPYLPHMPHSTNPAAMGALHPNLEICHDHSAETDTGMVDADGDACSEGGNSPSSAPTTPSPRSKFGHQRSKHTLNSWTIQPGMKKSFSIGYRADCDKCRQKIPGHFNHIIVS